jgi:L-lactate dehydrogenase complex protein LldE
MKIGLFIPCYVDAFFPEVGIATLELLERFGCSIEYPLNQTCCGQPMANSGCQEDSAATEALFVECFKGFDTIVGPSGSCVHHIRCHLDAVEQTEDTRKVRTRTRELVEFLHDDLKVNESPWAGFPHKVGLHDSCSAVRGLGHARPSELSYEPYFSKTRDLLGNVAGLELIEIDRPDACCGFGGSFCVTDEAVSAKMGYDRVHDFYHHGAEYIASADILSGHGVKSLIKSKSMLQDQCGMTPYLEKPGIEVTESDLGERIQQLSHEAPSHNVVPAIHKLRSDVASLFAENIGTDPKDSDPHHFAEAMRQAARPRFMDADAGMTGANFAIAETGGFVVVTNEGNADMGASVPPLHIASIGIEKLIPRTQDLGVFIRMLARSAFGCPMSPFTSHFHGPRRDGELHVVLVDNTRSERLGSADFW